MWPAASEERFWIGNPRGDKKTNGLREETIGWIKLLVEKSVHRYGGSACFAGPDADGLLDR